MPTKLCCTSLVCLKACRADQPKWTIWTLNSIYCGEYTQSASLAGTKAACHGSPCAGEVGSARASPPHHTATVTKQLFVFSNHSLLISWLIIHHLRGKQRAFMYTTPIAVFIGRVSGLPGFHVCPLSQGESYRQHHMIAGSPSFAVCTVYSSHSALLCFHQMSPLVLDFVFLFFFCISLKTYLS